MTQSACLILAGGDWPAGGAPGSEPTPARRRRLSPAGREERDGGRCRHCLPDDRDTALLRGATGLERKPVVEEPGI